MNTLKPLLIVAVLAGIGYGVYVRINRGNDAPPPDVGDGWKFAPQVQLPGEAAAPSAGPWGPGGGVAPGFAPPRTVPTVPPRNGETPPFTSPPVVGARSSGPLDAIVQPGELAAPQVNVPTAGDMMPEHSRTNPYGATSAPEAYAPPSTRPADRATMPQTPYDTTAPDAFAPPVTSRGGAAQEASSGFLADLEAAQRELESGQLTAALQHLTAWYDDARLSPTEQQVLNQLLDQVAGTVVYSTQHHLEPPYEVQPGERLEDIGQKYSVPWQLLAKINGIDDPQGLRPGERLKVIRGPFTAVISLEKRQLTLIVNGAYAGRFAIGIGREHPPQAGTYTVSDKLTNPIYQGRDRAAGGGDPSNPLGDRWIGLGSEIGIHGTNRPDNIGRSDLPGSISLSPRDIADVYDILTIGSKVIIRR